jgi:hypothetical protein
MSGMVQDTLEAGREAMRRHDWEGARRLLSEADATGKLDAEGLRQLGIAAGGRYRGRGVHEASRIASLAEPDEIVASRATVPTGVSVSEPREVAVKGNSKPIEVVRVDWRR